MPKFSPHVALGLSACVLLGVAWNFAPTARNSPRGLETGDRYFLGGTRTLRGFEYQQQGEVQITTVPAGGSVSMLAGSGGNIGVSVGDDGVLMIDDEFERLAPKIQDAINALTKSTSTPRFLINTHFHGDHTGGNAVFGKGATVVAHDNVRKRLLEPTGNAKPMAPAGLPMVTFGESLSVHFNGEEVRVTHYPNCHTDGDAVIEFTKSKVVHLGDLFFKDRFPYVDLASGGSVRGLEQAIASLIGSLPADAKLIPGHGDLATIADLQRYDEMLKTCLKLVADAHVSGKTDQQIVEAKPLAQYDSWGAGFIKTDDFVKTILGELANAKARK
jgi:glyoxylase-like metal-dependent hydrolase (beta-lactamase superfamily II)